MTNTTLLQIFILKSMIKGKSYYPDYVFKMIQNKGIEIKLRSTHNSLKALEKMGYVESITKAYGKLYIISDQGIALLEKIEYINSLFLTKQ